MFDEEIELDPRRLVEVFLDCSVQDSVDVIFELILGDDLIRLDWCQGRDCELREEVWELLFDDLSELSIRA